MYSPPSVLARRIYFIHSGSTPEPWQGMHVTAGYSPFTSTCRLFGPSLITCGTLPVPKQLGHLGSSIVAPEYGYSSEWQSVAISETAGFEPATCTIADAALTWLRYVSGHVLCQNQLLGICTSTIVFALG